MKKEVRDAQRYKIRKGEHNDYCTGTTQAHIFRQTLKIQAAMDRKTEVFPRDCVLWSVWV